MFNKTKIVIFATIIFYSIIVFPQSLELRYFPDICSKELQGIFYNSNKQSPIFIAIRDKLFQLKDVKFEEFLPKIPIENVLIYHVEIIDKNDIWVFYQNDPDDYYTRCIRFNENKWQNIKMPQNSLLKSWDFFDTNKFYAIGMFGSLVYYDGKKAVNIKTFPYSYSDDLQVLAENELFFVVQNDDTKSNEKLFYMKNGEYKYIYETKSTILYMNFRNSENGYFIERNGSVIELRNGILTKVDSIKILNESITSFNDNAYFVNDNGIWKYELKNKTKLLDNKNGFTDVYPISDNEYFFKKNYLLYYYGKNGKGFPININRTYFTNVTYNYTTSGDVGISLYKNRKNNIQAYFTAFYDFNHFFELKKNIVNGEMAVNNLLSSNLLGYGSNISDNRKHFVDAGMFFNDIDNDGDADAVMAALKGGGLIYENEGNDKFFDVTKIYDFKLDGRTKNIFWEDLNYDGNVDMVVGPGSRKLKFILNKGYWNFEDKTDAYIIPDSLLGFTPTLADVDNDNDRDLFLYNVYDHIYYFENQTEKKENAKIKFVDKSYLSPELTTRFDFFPYWFAFGDYDNDGDLDLFSANRITSLKLFENNGKGIFKDVTEQKGINKSCFAYTANWGDFNNDGFQDLFLGTVGLNYIFWNQDGEKFIIDSLSFEVNEKELSVGSVVNDIDNDGDLDIVVATSEFGLSRLFINSINNKNFIKIVFPFTKTTGTKVWLYNQDKTQLLGYREIETSIGYFSSGLPEAHFGVDSSKIYNIDILYPYGKKKEYKNVKAGSQLIIQLENRLSKFDIIKQFLLSLIYNKRKQTYFWNILILLIFTAFLTYFAFAKYRWRLINLLFFYFIVTTFFTLIQYLTSSLSDSFRVYAQLYGTLFFSLLIYVVIIKFIKTQKREIRHFELFDLLRQYNHSNSGVKFIHHIKYLLNNRQLEDTGWKNNLISELKSLNDSSIPILERIGDYYSKLFFENLLNKQCKSLKHDISKIIKGDKLNDKFLDNLNIKLHILNENLKEIRKKVDGKYKVNLFEKLSEVLNRYPSIKEFNIIKNTTDENIFVIMRSEDFVQIINNIIQNAVEAMQNLKNKKIDLIIEKIGIAKIQIIIRDYGMGLPKNINNNLLFEEHFSAKGSTGYGLYHIKKILDTYSGSITLTNPLTGNGTKVIVKMRIHYENNFNA